MYFRRVFSVSFLLVLEKWVAYKASSVSLTFSKIISILKYPFYCLPTSLHKLRRWSFPCFLFPVLSPPSAHMSTVGRPYSVFFFFWLKGLGYIMCRAHEYKAVRPQTARRKHWQWRIAILQFKEKCSGLLLPMVLMLYCRNLKDKILADPSKSY